MINIANPTKNQQFARHIQMLVDHANCLKRAAEGCDITWVKHHLSKASETVVAIEDSWHESRKNDSTIIIPEETWEERQVREECEDE